MSSDGSVSRWLNRLLTGDRNAVQPLWELYFHRLVTMARQKLRDLPRTVADEEDVALSAFDSFCRRAEQGKFPLLAFLRVPPLNPSFRQLVFPVPANQFQLALDR